MYEKNLLGNVRIRQEFEDGVHAFIEWAKCQRAHMDCEKIRCPCWKWNNERFKITDEVMYGLCMKGFVAEYYNWTSHGKARVQEYYEAATAPVHEQISAAHETTTHWGDCQQMHWDQMMVFDAAGPEYFLSYVKTVPDEGLSSCPTDADQANRSSCYDVSGLSDRFSDVVHTADQPLYNGYNESQLSTVARS